MGCVENHRFQHNPERPPTSLSGAISSPRAVLNLPLSRKDARSQHKMAEASSVKKHFEWTKNATLRFIELLKQHPCIWDVKSKEYKIKNKRRAKTLHNIVSWERGLSAAAQILSP